MQHVRSKFFRATEEYQHAQSADFRSYRYDYSFFDYNFIQGYCYANMYDYEVNQTSGYVDKGTGLILISYRKIRIKAFVIHSMYS